MLAARTHLQELSGECKGPGVSNSLAASLSQSREPFDASDRRHCDWPRIVSEYKEPGHATDVDEQPNPAPASATDGTET
jgi:hypothetical protein